jgi:hypothetical protein
MTEQKRKREGGRKGSLRKDQIRNQQRIKIENAIKQS